MPYPSQIMLPTGRAVVTTTSRRYVVCGDPPLPNRPDVELATDNWVHASTKVAALKAAHPHIQWFVMRRK